MQNNREHTTSFHRSRSMILFLIFFSIVLVNMLVSASKFADYYSYLELVDGYVYFSSNKSVFFEPASTYFFIILRNIINNTPATVNTAHYILGLFYIISICIVSIKFNLKWESILIVFAVFGPLLAFVTIRATPAYFLIAFSYLLSIRGSFISIVLLGVAILFHMSAALCIVPIVVSYLNTKYFRDGWIYNAGLKTIIILTIGGLLILNYREIIATAAFDIVSAIPFFGRYTTYLTVLQPNAEFIGNQSQSSGIFHSVYAVILSIFLFTYLISPDENCKKSRVFVVISFVIFAMLQFSPVSAYRQSIFWAMPMILTFPWGKYLGGKLGVYPLIVACSAAFAIQLGIVIE